MRRLFYRRMFLALLFLAGVGVVATGVAWVSFTSALDQLETRGRADLALASDRLSAQIQRYRELAVLLSDHPDLVTLVEQGGDPAKVQAVLRLKADQTGTRGIQLLDGSRKVLAYAGRRARLSGADPAYRRAMNGALGAAHFVNDKGLRLYTFAAPIFTAGGPSGGAVMVTIDLSDIEDNWPADPSAVYFSDAKGVVFVTSRSELVLAAQASRDRPAESIRSFPPYKVLRVRQHLLWNIDGGRYLPAQAMHLTQPMPVISMTGEILIDTSTARRIALLQGAVAGALALAFGSMLSVARERRRAMAQRLSVEAAANTRLEARVEARTRELSATNQTLRKAQADLVQADKLAALGQMSAGISHELNQPLMAIRSFAENGATLLARGKGAAAGENLSRISELARRMGRIIKNLRAFARQESEEITDVDLVLVVDAVLELAARRLLDEGIEVIWARPAKAVTVRGGEVRLQQVLMNLISNAADAMGAVAKRRLEILVQEGAQVVKLIVSDSGPGIDDPGKIFDPFYSTKEVGLSEGMGLGLSISYGLVQSFGGMIRGRNPSHGGAEFTVELTRSSPQVAV